MSPLWHDPMGRACGRNLWEVFFFVKMWCPRAVGSPRAQGRRDWMRVRDQCGGGRVVDVPCGSARRRYTSCACGSWQSRARSQSMSLAILRKVR